MFRRSSCDWKTLVSEMSIQGMIATFESTKKIEHLKGISSHIEIAKLLQQRSKQALRQPAEIETRHIISTEKMKG